jgi:hypothetical protein
VRGGFRALVFGFYAHMHGLVWHLSFGRVIEDDLCTSVPVRSFFDSFPLVRGPPSHPKRCIPKAPKTWIEYTPNNLVRISELHGIFGTYMNWWLVCKDRKAWTNALHKVVEIHTSSLDGKRVTIISIIIPKALVCFGDHFLKRGLK